MAPARWRYCFGAALLIWTSAAAERDPAQLLAHVSAKVRARTARLPNYTCVQSVERNYYLPRASTLRRPCKLVLDIRRHPGPDMALRLTLTDRLRLDVTMTGNGELYSWAGASKFEDSGIDQLVHEGPIGTGSFGALLAILFKLDATFFHFTGARSVEGRDLMEYSFEVPARDSQYTVKTPEGWVHTAFRGAFLADPETEEVAHLTAETIDMPEASGSCQTTNTMDLGLVQIGEGRFLLPKQGVQHFVDMTGAEVENTTTIGQCREFRGESTLNFGDASEDLAGVSGSVAKLRPAPAGIPPGLSFTIELTDAIAVDTAAGGDPFTGRLVGALRERGGRTLAPAHSVVKGRVLRVESRRLAPLASVVVLQPRSIEIGGVPVPVTANRQREFVPAGRAARNPVLLPYAWEKNAAAFPLTGGHPVLRAGTRSDWVTAAPAATPAVRQ